MNKTHLKIKNQRERFLIRNKRIRSSLKTNIEESKVAIVVQVKHLIVINHLSQKILRRNIKSKENQLNQKVNKRKKNLKRRR
jgi:formylmethanofuran:tetrahydromethanopterin formyltransferase